MQLLECVEIRLSRRPSDSQSLRLIRLRDHVEVNMVDLLVCNAPVVLQHIVVDGAARGRELLHHRQDLRQRVVRYVG